MITPASICRIIGISQTDEPRLLLGITKGRNDVSAIRTALRRRLAQLHVHPQRQSDEVNQAKAFLIDIASELIQNATDEIDKTSLSEELTDLDRSIIATLVSERGWNKKSRARLVGIAASYSLTVGGLSRILQSFAEATRNGTSPLSKNRNKNYKINKTWASIPRPKTRLSTIDSFISETASKLTPELNSNNPIMTIKLAALFGLLTLLAFVLALQALFSEQNNSIQQNNTPVARVIHSVENDIDSFQTAFESYPTFSNKNIIKDVLRHSDISVADSNIIDEIKIQVEDSALKGTPLNQKTVEAWQNYLTSFSIGWPTLDNLFTSDIESRIIKTIFEAQSDDQITASLLSSFEIKPIRFSSPLSVISNIWSSRMIAKMSCDYNLIPNTRAFIQQLQYEDIQTCDPDLATSLAATLIGTKLLSSTEFDERSLTIWESWLLVERKLRPTTQNYPPSLTLISNILQADIDLQRQSNTLKVLGRIINDFPWTTLPDSGKFITDLIRSDIFSSSDYYVLTTLFSMSNNTSWFNDEHILDVNSTLNERRAVADAVQANWPIDFKTTKAIWNLSIPIGFNSTLAKEVTSEATKLIDAPNIYFSKLAKLRYLNESALNIWLGRPDLAQLAINSSKQLEINSYDLKAAIYPDIDFRDEFKLAGSDIFDQIEAIDQLYNYQISDLHPDDADLLAQIAFHHGKTKVRRSAVEIIINKFAQGKNIAIALLNNFKNSRSDSVLSIIANLTRSSLPDIQNPNWNNQARKAIAQHALVAGEQKLQHLDEIASHLRTSLVSEYVLLNPDLLPPSDQISANDAIELVIDSWRNRLNISTDRENFSFQTNGLLHRYLTDQISYFKLLSKEIDNWRSDKTPDTYIDSIAQKLQEDQDIIDQLISLEEEIAKFWSTVLDEVTTEVERRDKR